jgi:Domain of unknown function (DUF4386)
MSPLPESHDSTGDPQTIARLTGLLFLITFATSIPALFLYDPVLNDTNFIIGSGAIGRVTLGAVLELILIVANIATAVVLYPIVKRQSKILALGFVTARIMESVFIAIGIVSVLAVVTLRRSATGADETLVPIGEALVAIKDWTFVLGPGFVVGIGNGLILGYLMYRSGLVPRRMAMLGLVGGPLIFLSGIAVVMNVIEKGSAGQNIATIPEFFWELLLGIYLMVKGFKPAPILDVTNAGVFP